MKKKKLWVSISSVCLALVVVMSIAAGCAAPAPTPAPTPAPAPTPGAEPPAVSEWRIPMLNILSGVGAFFGADLTWAAEQAAEEINAAGGIRGLPVVIEEYDTAWTPDKAVQMLAKAAAAGGLVVIGPASPGESTACGQLANRIGIPYFGYGPPWDELYKGQGWLVSVNASCFDNGVAAFREWIRLNPDFESVAIIYVGENDGSWLNYEPAAKVATELGLEVFSIEFPETTLDYRAVALRALKSNPDAFYICYWGATTLGIIKGLRDGGVTEDRRIAVTTGNLNDAYLQGGEDIDGTYIFEQFNHFYEGERFKQWKQKFREDTGRTWANQNARHHYDEVWMIKDAIEELGITGDPAKLAQERIAIRDWLYAMDGWQGLQDTYTMTSTGGCQMPAFLYVVDSTKPLIEKPILISKDLWVPVPEEYR